jgi:hypothetical protein
MKEAKDNSYSLDFLCEEEEERATEQRKSSSPFSMPEISFEFYYNSSKATRGLRLFCVWGNTSLTGTESLMKSCVTIWILIIA